MWNRQRQEIEELRAELTETNRLLALEAASHAGEVAARNQVMNELAAMKANVAALVPQPPPSKEPPSALKGPMLLALAFVLLWAAGYLAVLSARALNEPVAFADYQALISVAVMPDTFEERNEDSVNEPIFIRTKFELGTDLADYEINFPAAYEGRRYVVMLTGEAVLRHTMTQGGATLFATGPCIQGDGLAAPGQTDLPCQMFRGTVPDDVYATLDVPTKACDFPAGIRTTALISGDLTHGRLDWAHDFYTLPAIGESASGHHMTMWNDWSMDDDGDEYKQPIQNGWSSPW